MKRLGARFAGGEAGESLVEMVLITLFLVVGCVAIGGFVVSAITQQSGNAKQHSTCIVNVSDGTCR